MNTSLQVESAQADRQMMRAIIGGNTSQLAAGQAARSSVGAQTAAINVGLKAGTSVARSLGKIAGTDVTEEVLKRKKRNSVSRDARIDASDVH